MNLEWLPFLTLLLLVAVLFFRKAMLAVVLLCAVTVLAAALWYTSQHRKESNLADWAHTNPHEGRPGGFVSSNTCQSCHAEQYATWHKSYHRTMTQYANPEAVRGDFNHVTLELEGQTYKLERSGDEFWVEMPDPDWKLQATFNPARRSSASAERVRKRIGITTGSHHMQAYWVPSEKGNLQLNFPFTYLFEDQRWVPRNDTFLMDPEHPAGVQLWNTNCLQCHTTAGQPRPEAKDPFLLDTRAAEIGIGCEACHGPAEQHVRANQNPLRRYAQHREDDLQINRLIVNPAKLDHKASAQVCGQCHSIRWTPGNTWRDEGFRYRPGDDLEKQVPVVRPLNHAGEQWFKDHLKRNPTYVEDRYWSDGMVRVSGREYNGLLETPCYQKGTMNCLSCHSAHDSEPNHQLAAGMESNQACLQCHDKMQVQNHTRHQAGSSGSLCYNCHMPHTTYGLMKAIRSHTIDSPSVQNTLDTGRPNACNLCHLDKTLAWTARNLSTWYGQPPPVMSNDEQQISAAALGALRGDAGQRALVAWHMGWEPARKASGEKWIPPYLAQLLEDPYSTVRYIAQRSLKRLPEFQNFSYDYIAPLSDRTQARERALLKWNQPNPTEILSETTLDAVTWSRLLRERNNKSMYLQE
jgi:predicted CXXCH cytochrome family protein